MKDRKAGFYWTKTIGGRWRVAEWGGMIWSIDGDQEIDRPNLTVNENRIETPDESSSSPKNPFEDLTSKMQQLPPEFAKIIESRWDDLIGGASSPKKILRPKEMLALYFDQTEMVSQPAAVKMMHQYADQFRTPELSGSTGNKSVCAKCGGKGYYEYYSTPGKIKCECQPRCTRPNCDCNWNAETFEGCKYENIKEEAAEEPKRGNAVKEHVWLVERNGGWYLTKCDDKFKWYTSAERAYWAHSKWEAEQLADQIGLKDFFIADHIFYGRAESIPAPVEAAEEHDFETYGAPLFRASAPVESADITEDNFIAASRKMNKEGQFPLKMSADQWKLDTNEKGWCLRNDSLGGEAMIAMVNRLNSESADKGG